MKQLSLVSPQDFLAAFNRRKWWAIVVFLLSSTVSTLVISQLPEVYLSETLVLVEPREVPVDFVMELVSQDAQQRLESVTQRILSRSNLLRVISEFEEDLADYRQLDDEQRVAQLRQKIRIRYETDPLQKSRRSSDGGAFFFRVTYENRDPGMAQRVASRLASLFIEYDNRTREEQVFGTNEFLASELQKVARELETTSEELALLKRRYQYELPSQLNVNLRALDRLNHQVQTNTEAMDRATSMRLDLERQLSETEPVIRVKTSGVARVTPNGSRPSRLVIELRQKEAQYKDLNTRYTEHHPDVRRLKTELEQLRATIPPVDLLEIEIEENETNWDFTYEPNPVYQQLRSQLVEVKRQLSMRTEERDWLQTEIQKYSIRVQNTPAREQAISSVVRRHRELTSQYEDLRRKLVEGKLAESLESRQKGAQFAIVDPANFPLAPSRPDRPRLTAIALMMSLLTGLGLAFCVEFLDQKLWTHSEVERFFQAPVLIEIPRITTEEDVRKEQKRRRLVLAASVVGGMVALSLGLTVYTTPFLRAVASRYLTLLVEQSSKAFNL